MKSKTLSIIGFVFVAILSAFALRALFPSEGPRLRAPSSIGGVVRILPLGDSLTEGIDDNGGYRPELHRLLNEAGVTFDFVGTQTSGPRSLSDRDHQGFGGYRIDQIESGIDNVLDRYRPQIILLGAGGNDIAQGYEVAKAPERLLDLARHIAAHLPTAYVIVQTRPMRPAGLNDLVLEFNDRVRDLVAREATSNPRIFLQDNAKLIEAGDVGPDGIHPNERGNRKLAAGWFAAIQRIL